MPGTPLARRVALALTVAVAVAGCSDPDDRRASETPDATTRTPTTAPSTAPTTTAPTTAPPSTPTTPDPLAGLALEEVVGQLFMTGTSPSAAENATLTAIDRHHVGGVMLRGRSEDGVATTAKVVRRLRAEATRSGEDVPLLVATDQEGGLVQVLRGPGFSEIPRALTQGGWPTATVRSRARTWGRQLHAAGVDLNLAPVLDTVPSPKAAERNAPIGAFDRQYGFTPAVVSAKGLAFLAGMNDAGVIGTVKHFPGLGRVTANTDTTGNVHDTTTRADDAYLAPFRQAIARGARVVMMSTATYDRIDPRQPAAFSPRVVTGLLRGRLGFDGVVVSDDVSAARQVSDRSPGRRAIDFLRAGGDLVLAVDPAQMPEMTAAVLREARSNPAFRTRVEQAAARVLALKRAHG